MEQSPPERMARICRTIERALELPGGVVSPQGQQGEVEKWDSLGHLSVVMELEAEFGVSFSTDEALNMRSVPLIAVAVEGRLRGN